jgi:hypothetical protein
MVRRTRWAGYDGNPTQPPGAGSPSTARPPSFRLWSVLRAEPDPAERSRPAKRNGLSCAWLADVGRTICQESAWRV